MDIFAFLVIGIASNSGTALTTMPQPYEYNQCWKVADEYKWPYKATCVLAPKTVQNLESRKTLYTKTEIINELDKFDVLPGACYSQMLDRLFPCKGSMTK